MVTAWGHVTQVSQSIDHKTVKENSVKNNKERENPARIAMRYFHTDLCTGGHGI